MLLLLEGTEVLIEETATESFSLIGMAAKGGWLMLVLLLLSFLAIYIFGEKFWEIRKSSNINRKFMKKIHDRIAEGKIEDALTLCRKDDTTIARLIEKGIERLGRPLPDIQASIENMGNVEVARLERGLPILATISGGAPMIGFLGTVTGMIRAFFNMSQAGSNVDITLLSGGIYEAMLTTVGGLFVGIIAYFGYNFLTSRISDLVFQMESVTIEFMDMLYEPSGEKKKK
ncbi:MAG: MotA/TolQ/ExbB proton channel family protein [Alistipes sp.]|nr:MotA/TolQ/ExbB proton channel family protein [Candidatus Minthomonas equi]